MNTILENHAKLIRVIENWDNYYIILWFDYLLDYNCHMGTCGTCNHVICTCGTLLRHVIWVVRNWEYPIFMILLVEKESFCPGGSERVTFSDTAQIRYKRATWQAVFSSWWGELKWTTTEPLPVWKLTQDLWHSELWTYAVVWTLLK